MCEEQKQYRVIAIPVRTDSGVRRKHLGDFHFLSTAKDHARTEQYHLCDKGYRVQVYDVVAEIILFEA